METTGQGGSLQGIDRKGTEQKKQEDTGSESFETDSNIIEFEIFETDDLDFSPTITTPKESSKSEAEDVVDRIFDAATTGTTKDLSRLIFKSHREDGDRIVGELSKPKKHRRLPNFPLKRKSSIDSSEQTKRSCQKPVEFKDIQNTLKPGSRISDETGRFVPVLPVRNSESVSGRSTGKTNSTPSTQNPEVLKVDPKQTLSSSSVTTTSRQTVTSALQSKADTNVYRSKTTVKTPRKKTDAIKKPTSIVEEKIVTPFKKPFNLAPKQFSRFPTSLQSNLILGPAFGQIAGVSPSQLTCVASGGIPGLSSSQLASVASNQITGLPIQHFLVPVPGTFPLSSDTQGLSIPPSGATGTALAAVTGILPSFPVSSSAPTENLSNIPVAVSSTSQDTPVPVTNTTHNLKDCPAAVCKTSPSSLVSSSSTTENQSTLSQKPQTVIDFTVLTNAIKNTIDSRLELEEDSDIKLVLFCNSEPLQAFSILKDSPTQAKSSQSKKDLPDTKENVAEEVETCDLGKTDHEQSCEDKIKEGNLNSVSGKQQSETVIQTGQQAPPVSSYLGNRTTGQDQNSGQITEVSSDTDNTTTTVLQTRSSSSENLAKDGIKEVVPIKLKSLIKTNNKKNTQESTDTQGDNKDKFGDSLKKKTADDEESNSINSEISIEDLSKAVHLIPYIDVGKLIINENDVDDDEKDEIDIEEIKEETVDVPQPLNTEGYSAQQISKETPSTAHLPYECDICFKVFKCKRYLSKHKLRVHGIIYKDTVEILRDLAKTEEAEARKVFQIEGRKTVEELLSEKLEELNKESPKEEGDVTSVVDENVSQSEEDFINQLLNKSSLPTAIHEEQAVESGGSPKVGSLQSLALREKQGETFHIDPVFVCEHCGKFYRARKSLKDHFKREHATEKDQEPLYIFISTDSFNCSLCFKSFPDPYQLVAHSREHTRDNQLKCVLCEKIYSSVQVLRRHIDTIHQDIRPRPFKCRHCDYAAANRWHLKEHQRRHTGEQPYQCPICLKNFSHQGTMNRHCKVLHNVLATEPKRLFYTEDVPEAKIPHINPLRRGSSDMNIAYSTASASKPTLKKKLSGVQDKLAKLLTLKTDSKDETETGPDSDQLFPNNCTVKVEPGDSEEITLHTKSPVSFDIKENVNGSYQATRPVSFREIITHVNGKTVIIKQEPTDD